MSYEIKKVDKEFEDKYPEEGNINTLLLALSAANNTIKSCNNAIEGAGLSGISYVS